MSALTITLVDKRVQHTIILFWSTSTFSATMNILPSTTGANCRLKHVNIFSAWLDKCKEKHYDAEPLLVRIPAVLKNLIQHPRVQEYRVVQTGQLDTESKKVPLCSCPNDNQFSKFFHHETPQ